jgi:hypothetical protein
MQLKQ